MSIISLASESLQTDCSVEVHNQLTQQYREFILPASSLLSGGRVASLSRVSSNSKFSLDIQAAGNEQFCLSKNISLARDGRFVCCGRSVSSAIRAYIENRRQEGITKMVIRDPSRLLRLSLSATRGNQFNSDDIDYLLNCGVTFYSRWPIGISERELQMRARNESLSISNGQIGRPYTFDSDLVTSLIVEFVESGMGNQRIANELNRQGIKQSNHRTWDKDSVRNLRKRQGV